MFKCYTQGRVIPRMVPARPHRQWMDEYPERHAYRCLPLTVANTFGWELLSPCDVKVDWNGGMGMNDLKVTAEDGFPFVQEFAISNFARGILTLHAGYLFVTDPGWMLLAMGPVNEPIEGMAPLTGLIETDWLPYPFAMNWQMQRPGTYRIKKDQPFCHILPVQVEPVLQMTPEIHDISSNPKLEAQLASYRATRNAIRAKQQEIAATGRAPTEVQPWSKEYFRGELKDGTIPENHYNKIRLADPVDHRTRKFDEELLAETLQARAVNATIPKYGIGTFGYSSDVTYGPPKKPK
ncbi:MAG: hypothetical protein K2P94_10295 [Rhodospirillaceae bacterium]|nr:hypothetical protein [Rhodospirillaceae bacterium]